MNKAGRWDGTSGLRRQASYHNMAIDSAWNIVVIMTEFPREHPIMFGIQHEQSSENFYLRGPDSPNSVVVILELRRHVEKIKLSRAC